MKKLTKKFFAALTLLFAGSIFTGQAQTIYFNGLGRALVTAEGLYGNALKADPTATTPTANDVTSARKGTDGYTVFDLGVNAQPNESLRASVILRVRNAFGGFYGDGSSLTFRQMRLDGIVARKVKYELGDIDLELSPYTLYNFNEMYHEYENETFAIRRSVVGYENFNFGNKWRTQGAHLSSTFKFNKGIEKITVRAFTSRLRRTNFANLPDRFIGGGRLEILQSKNFQLGGNYMGLYDAVKTVPSSAVSFNNHVLTADFKAIYDGVADFDFSLFGEAGFSSNSYLNKGIDTAKGKDYFYDLGISAKHKPTNIKLAINYRDVGFDFTSPGAQTRRIVDVDWSNTASRVDPTIFPSLANNALYQSGDNLRVGNMLDRMSDEYTRNLTLRTTLMDYLPQFNNITPYGQATPNRRGLTIGLTGGDNDRVLKGEAYVDLLNEVVAVGAADGVKRKFMGIRGGVLFNLHKVLRFEKAIAINAGMRYENTTRGGNNIIDLNSNIIDLGLRAELVKQLDLLFGYKTLTYKGNEVVSIYDAVNNISGYRLYNNLDGQEGLLSGGFRYRFSKNTYFSALGYLSTNKFKTSALDYNIKQVFLNYTMIF